MATYGGKTEIKDAQNNSEINSLPQAGGKTEIKDAENNPEINRLARFAVDEHNKKQNSHLELKKVVKAEKQVVAGFMYYIFLDATDGGFYEAKVLLGLNSKEELVEFKLIEDA